MTQEHATEKQPIAPEWATQPFHRFLDQAERLGDVVQLSVRGISVFLAIPSAVAVLAKVEEKDKTTEHKQRLERVRKDAELAQREIETGFPIVFANATVALWSFLESMVRATLVAWLKNDSKAFQSDAIAKLRIRLGEYERLMQDERYHYVAELLEAELAAGLRNGVERFEVMLKPFGLDGSVPEKLRRDMFEFGQIRNAIVHRGGHVDRQLSNACPWLGFAVGEELPIGRDHFNRYGEAAHYYVILLICRMGECFGKDMTDEKQSVIAKYGPG